MSELPVNRVNVKVEAASLFPNPTLIGSPASETMVQGRNIATPGPVGEYQIWLQSNEGSTVPYVFNVPGDSNPGWKFDIYKLRGKWGITKKGNLRWIGRGRYVVRFKTKVEFREYPANDLFFGPAIRVNGELYSAFSDKKLSLFNAKDHGTGQWEAILDINEPLGVEEVAFLWQANWASFDVSAILEHFDLLKVPDNYLGSTAWASDGKVYAIGAASEAPGEEPEDPGDGNCEAVIEHIDDLVKRLIYAMAQALD